jgi:hypothetical protein
VVARDRGGGYVLAVAKALPHAIQVADRWHLMENASHAFLDAVRKSMRQVRVAVGAVTINPALLTAAERIQYEGYLRREETNAAILRQADTGVPIKEIVRLTGHSRASSARCCEVSERTCSECLRVLSNIIWLGLMSSQSLAERRARNSQLALKLRETPRTKECFPDDEVGPRVSQDINGSDSAECRTKPFGGCLSRCTVFAGFSTVGDRFFIGRDRYR